MATIQILFSAMLASLHPRVILIAVLVGDLHYACCEDSSKAYFLFQVHLQVPHCNILRQRFLQPCGDVQKNDLLE